MGPTGSNGIELPGELIASIESKLVMSCAAIGDGGQGPESCGEQKELPSITENGKLSTDPSLTAFRNRRCTKSDFLEELLR